MSASRDLSVFIVEDHPMVRTGVVHTLERSRIGVAGEAATIADAYESVGRTSPDVVIVDVRLPDGSGIDLTRRLIRRNGNLGIVIYTGAEDAVELKDALDCGARGFVFKTAGPEALVAAVHAVGRGGTHVSPEALEQIRQLQGSDTDRVLSDREREIVFLLAEGCTGDEIAARLSLSSETVRTHVRNAIRKLDASNRTHAVVLALRNEEIRLPSR
jgi:DNA-binding NarL/FixJ family response regulator